MENLFCEGCENHFRPLMDFDTEVPNYPDLQIKDYKRTLALYTRKDGQVHEALLKYPEKSGGIPTNKKLQFMNDFFKYLIRL